VLSGARISMGRLLEKVGPALYSPKCVEGVLRTSQVQSSKKLLPP
jgi:hypothetical protein